MFVNFTASPSLPSSRIKPSVNWFRSFVSTFRIHVTFISIVRCFPLFFSFFSSLFSSPSPSSSLFFLPLSVFFLFHIATRLPNLFATRPLFLHDSILQRFWYSVAMDTRSPINHERFAYNCETFEHRGAFYFDDPWRYREGEGREKGLLCISRSLILVFEFALSNEC